MPRRKKKCPSCGEYIFVRTKQGLFPSPLLTEQDARVVDHFQRLKGSEGPGIGQADFLKERQKLAQQLGTEPESGDVAWSLCQGILHRFTRAGRPPPSPLSFEMALLLYGQGRDFLELLQQSARTTLTQYAGWGVAERVEIRAIPDACDFCRRLSGRVLTIEDALDQMRIPCRECSFELSPGKPGWCRCSYVPVVEDAQVGRDPDVK
jgi:hypothetical protein